MFALMLSMGAFFFSAPVYASDGDSPAPLSVDAAWLEGDTLHIKVTDTNTGADQSLELNLRDYAGSTDQYVTVQAIDRDGNKSNSIQFKNPFYEAPAASVATASATPVTAATEPGQSNDVGSGSSSAISSDNAETSQPSIVPNNTSNQIQSSIPITPSSSQPFTPDGAGTVVDNAANVDGKEFFTVKAADGAVFYLIVDRQKTTDNVYFLDTVKENDLMSLAQPSAGTGVSAIPGSATATASPTASPLPTATPEPSAAPAAKSGDGINGGALIFIALAAFAVGGVGWYFKIYKPKHQAADSGEEEDYDDIPDDSDDGDDDEDDYGAEDYDGGDEGADEE